MGYVLTHPLASHADTHIYAVAARKPAHVARGYAPHVVDELVPGHALHAPEAGH